MKRIVIFLKLFTLSSWLFGQDSTGQMQKDSFYLLSPVEIRSVRASDLAPFTKTNLVKSEISKLNLGQDIPYLLEQTPSVVANSDAGNGIGYTGIRIRGIDATRINITLNGIPYNDAESQGSFFVDLPDFTSSTGSIQVQRGVGTSSNGPGAFGASINLSTNERNERAYAEFNNSVGSFNSWKNTIKAGTGLIAQHFTTDLRLSRISSNGFIDRATSDLRSFYFSTAYIGKSNSLRLNIFSGKEKTYQAWYGISEADLKAGKRRINYAGMEKTGTPYENETDNYIQDHYQLFFDQRFSKYLSFNTAIFLTTGKGYYEQYKAGQAYADYGLNITGNADFIRQLWLDNDFFGNIFSLQYRSRKTEAILGGSITRYNGNHFGELIWASNGLPEPTHRWYDLDANKNDLTIYLKEQTNFSSNWYYFYDLQYRRSGYIINGFRNNPTLKVNNRYNFFNPKLGISFLKAGWRSYLSFAIAHKEPNRDDFETGLLQQPNPERLYDLEAGIERRNLTGNWSATFYYMKYRDQLVLTGKINDVGAYTRTNIPDSYRAGLELQAGYKINKHVSLSANLALSENKVLNFEEFVDDYDNGVQVVNQFKKTTIAYSPSIVGSWNLALFPFRNIEINLLGKHVGKQYLDNTSQENRKLDPFYVQDLRIAYNFKKSRVLKESNIVFLARNLFNEQYEPNGYTYSYIYGGELSVNNYYFPMAGICWMLGVNFKF